MLKTTKKKNNNHEFLEFDYLVIDRENTGSMSSSLLPNDVLFSLRQRFIK